MNSLIFGGFPSSSSLWRVLPTPDRSVCFQNVNEHSIVFSEDLESYIEESEENSCKDEVPDYGHFKASPIPENVCNDALELENIERMLDEALNGQQREWTRNAARGATHCS